MEKARDKLKKKRLKHSDLFTSFTEAPERLDSVITIREMESIHRDTKYFTFQWTMDRLQK